MTTRELAQGAWGYPDNHRKVRGRRGQSSRADAHPRADRDALMEASGIFRAISVWHSRQAPGFAWSFFTAVLSVVLGLILIFHPLAGVLTLTMVLVAFFIIEGIASIVAAIEHRRHLGSWGWVLFSGIIDLLLAYLIWQGWPSSAAWAIGLLVGINMLFLGLSLVMTALAARLMGSQ